MMFSVSGRCTVCVVSEVVLRLVSSVWKRLVVWGSVSFMSQVIGTVMGVAIAFISGLIVYGVIKKVVGLRLTQEQEFDGADLSIHKIGSEPPNAQ